MTTDTFRILGIAGSLRRGSYNRSLLRAAQELAPTWVRIDPYEIGRLPFFNEDRGYTKNTQPET